MNKALLAKNTWRFIHNTSSLATRWACKRYASSTKDMSFKSPSSASFILNGIQKNGDLILNLLKWRIGDGASIDITSTRCILPWEWPKGIFTVADLWDTNAECWNYPMFHGLYGQHDCSFLNYIRPSTYCLKDKLVWSGHSSGHYLVSAGYEWLVSNRPGNSAPSVGPSLFPWKEFWKRKVPFR